MGKRFIDKIIKFLDTLYNNQGPSVKTPLIDELLFDPEYKNVVPYLVLRKFIHVTYKNEKNNDVGPHNIKHVHLTDPGMEFLNEHNNRETQKEFNKIIAITGCIIALVTAYNFLKDIWDPKYLWIIALLCFFLVFGALVPLVKFVYDYGFKDKK